MDSRTQHGTTSRNIPQSRLGLNFEDEIPISWEVCNTPQQKSRPDFFYFIIIYAYFYAYILGRIHLRMIRPFYTYFETQTISYPDSASCVGILTEPTMLFSNHHESRLSRVVCIGRIVVVYPYMHPCALFRSTRLSKPKPRCFLDPEDTLRS